jgi:hypothetical protein
MVQLDLNNTLAEIQMIQTTTPPRLQRPLLQGSRQLLLRSRQLLERRC